MSYASRKQLQVKKKQGGEALLAKIVSTLLSRKFDLILFGGATLLGARQGSSRDLDHQTRPCGKSEL